MAGYYGPGIYRTECAYYIRESEKMITCEGLEAVSYTHLDVYKRQRESFTYAEIAQGMLGKSN